MPVIGYNLNIPFATNNPSTDQPNMLTNTNAINTWNNIDHNTFSASNAGTHKQVTLTNEAAPGFVGGSGVFYANVQSGQSWPFWQNALGSFQMMQAAIATTNNGSTLIPGGIILKWGIVTPLVSTTTTPVTFSPVFPNNCFNVQATLINAGATGNEQTISIRSGSVVPGGFSYNYTGGSAYNGFYWFAVGN